MPFQAAHGSSDPRWGRAPVGAIQSGFMQFQVAHSSSDPWRCAAGNGTKLLWVTAAEGVMAPLLLGGPQKYLLPLTRFAPLIQATWCI